ncbi:nuclease [Bacillus solimangrovi]|uniref:Nuclease n=1 Tax=Bacillus solimangrovi TaxID=1305675 RepID=A0A1E5LEJ5_9BACI|nr:nuclease [Bacillus solimangrovi]
MINSDHSLYAIYLKLNEEHSITIGKLGTFNFPIGTYIYVGSAKRNIEARINRHLKIEKPLRWHFDYLRPYGEIIEVQTFDRTLSECGLYEKLLKVRNGTVIAKGFGSSDCYCDSHLIYVK